jgi:hypothetical protein
MNYNFLFVLKIATNILSKMRNEYRNCIWRATINLFTTKK